MLLKTPHDLNRIYYHSFRLFNTWHSQYSLVQYLLGLNNQLKPTYEKAHLILGTLKSNNMKQLTYALYTSRNNNLSEELKSVIKTLIKYLPYITNTIQYTHLTNGPTQGITNKIKIIKRVS